MKLLKEMAFNRSEAIDKINREVPPYRDHLIKCIVYGNSTNNLWHWSDEVADKINKVNNIKLKSGNKFEQKFYEDEFLLASGDCKSDFEIVLNNFLIDYRYKYPAFEITDALLDKVVEVFTDLSYYFSNQLCRENHLSKEQIRNKLLDYFELQGVV